MREGLYRFIFFGFILSIIFSSIHVQAQNYRLSQQWKLGAYIGATKFYGDLTDNSNSILNNTPFSSFFYEDRKLAGSFYIEKWINPFVGIRGMFFGGSVKSTQESSKQYFEANYYDYSLLLTLDFTSMIWGADNGRNISIYGFGGIGLSESQTLKYDLTSGSILATNGFGEPKREGSGRRPMTETVFPVGLGISLFASNPLSVNIEGHLHYVATNKLDATPVDGTNFESVGFISVGIVYSFNIKGLRFGGRNYQTFEGRSNEPALREFNKRKRVVMNTKMNRKAMKKRKKFRHQRY
ncbi:MAG: hypothetical protein DRI84_03400 [Bacteroidetes bacterium]|nr:MAG: hypothetical protein DRI84_03400 [Bacteroidota bacterium]